MGKFFYDLRIEKSFLGMTQNLDARKENINTFICIKIRIFCMANTTDRHTHTPSKQKVIKSKRNSKLGYNILNPWGVIPQICERL